MTETDTDGRVAVGFAVNGTPETVVTDPTRRLVEVLRENLGLTGTRIGCEVGVCGACTVLVDDRPTASCHTFAGQVDGREVLTVEGLAQEPRLRRLQEAFIAEGGFQCGYCTSGQLMTAAWLVRSGRLAQMSDEDIAEAMVGNLCRCGTYYGIARAIRAAAEVDAEGEVTG